MDTYGVDLMGRRRRRRHSAAFKATVIEECMRPGVSVAAVALAHGLNAKERSLRSRIANSNTGSDPLAGP